MKYRTTDFKTWKAFLTFTTKCFLWKTWATQCIQICVRSGVLNLLHTGLDVLISCLPPCSSCRRISASTCLTSSQPQMAHRSQCSDRRGLEVYTQARTESGVCSTDLLLFSSVFESEELTVQLWGGKLPAACRLDIIACVVFSVKARLPEW